MPSFNKKESKATDKKILNSNPSHIAQSLIIIIFFIVVSFSSNVLLPDQDDLVT